MSILSKSRALSLTQPEPKGRQTLPNLPTPDRPDNLNYLGEVTLGLELYLSTTSTTSVRRLLFLLMPSRAKTLS